jgi:predicted O-methyltransferase YrrM
VYNHFQLAKKYLQYYLTASNGKGHGMHSPFVFNFIVNVLNNTQQYDAPQQIETLRNQLLQDATTIEVEDFGAGSRLHSSRKKKVQDIAKAAVKPKKYGQLLYRFIKYYQPNTIIELGTSLGITTSYLATANANAKLITIEGSKAISAIAQANFQQLGITNIQSLTGNFDTLLPPVLQPLSFVDVGYIDGNHRHDPTLNYFHQFLDKSHNNTILIFDDIHWSAEMEAAWKTIQQHPSVQCTIDIFFLGFVFFRNEFKTKQHVTIRF